MSAPRLFRDCCAESCVIALLGLSACDANRLTRQADDPRAVVSVEIVKPAQRNDTLYWPYDGMVLTAIARNARGETIEDQPVVWSASDPKRVGLAPVTGDPSSIYASPLGVGDMTITATVQSTTGQITLIGAVAISTPIVLWPDTSRIELSMRRTLEVRRVAGINRPPYSVPAGVAWESSDPTVATVDSSGLVTPLREGSVSITATFPNHRLHAEVYVFRYPAPLDFTLASAGEGYTCALTRDGQAFCWGANGAGQLGDDVVMDRCQSFTTGAGLILSRTTYRCSEAPVPVNTQLRFTAISAGARTTCALTAPGAAYCWGWNKTETTGSGLTDSIVRTPTAVVGGIDFKSISVGAGTACAIAVSELLYCWGSGAAGALGDGTEIAGRSMPAPVSGGLAWRDVTVSRTTCGVSTDRVAYCWGRNWSGEAGSPRNTESCSTLPSSCLKTPTRVAGDYRFLHVESSAGDLRTCGLSDDFKAYCWGNSAPTTEFMPVLVPGGMEFVSIHYRGSQACGLRADGLVYCWGFLPSQDQHPTRALPGFVVNDFTQSSSHTCARDLSGILYCWGAEPVRVAGQP